MSSLLARSRPIRTDDKPKAFCELGGDYRRELLNSLMFLVGRGFPRIRAAGINSSHPYLIFLDLAAFLELSGDDIVAPGCGSECAGIPRVRSTICEARRSRGH
jgi:hypothetical protein